MARQAKIVGEQARSGDAREVQQCPVCNGYFFSERGGRLATYCSDACKQTAYRRRREMQALLRKFELS